MSDDKPKPVLLNDGWVPLQKGWTPKAPPSTAVQNGHTPTTSQVAAPPPTGGSGVQAPPKK